MIGFFLRLALALLATILAGRYILGEAGAAALIASGASGFAIVSLASMNLTMRGHGINGLRHIIGMPTFIFWVYAAMLCIALSMMLVSIPGISGLHPITGAHLRVFGLGLLFAWMGGIIDWYAFSSKMTHYASESREREHLASRGFDQKRIDSLIEDMRSRGLLPPRTRNRK